MNYNTYLVYYSLANCKSSTKIEAFNEKDAAKKAYKEYNAKSISLIKLVK